MDLSQIEWAARLNADENAVIIDVRTPEEHQAGMIPGSLNMDIFKGQGFIYMLEELDKSKNFYVYCRSGARSAQACGIMNQLGFENAFNLIGGFMQWQGAVAFPEQ